MHLIEYTKQASKALAAMPRTTRELVEAKVKALAADPYRASNSVKRLQGRAEYRLRVHEWRVVYRVLDDRMLLLIIKIGTRGQVYS